MTLARDVMTSDPVSVEPTASLMQAVRLMLRHRISGLPVVAGNGTLIGVVTEGDLLRRDGAGKQRRSPRWIEFLIGGQGPGSDYSNICRRKVHEVMSPEVFTVSEDTSVEDMVRIMDQHRVKRLPVLRGARLVGVVSRVDLVRAMAHTVRATKARLKDDESIRSHLLAEIDGQSWAPRNHIHVVVQNGDTQLWGTITDESHRQVLQAAARKTPGVKTVEDHLLLVEPLATACPDKERFATGTAGVNQPGNDNS